MLKRLLSLVLPAWVRPALLSAAAVSLFLLGVLTGVTHEGQKHIDYVTAQAARTVAIATKQIQIVHEVEIQYRDRIRNVYITGEKNVQAAPELVTAGDSGQCTVNAGFVRLHDAAWAGTVAAPATDTDRDPAPVSLTDVAAAGAENAAICLAWRTQAIGLRSFYEQLRGTTITPLPDPP